MMNVWRAVLLWGAALAFSPFFGSHEPRWAFVMIAGATGLVLVRRLSGPDLWGLAIIIWAGASLLWSEDWREGLTCFYPLVALYGIFLLFEHGRRIDLGPIATIAVLGAAILGNVFPDLNGGFFNQNWLTEFIVIAGVVAAVRGGVAGLAVAAGAIIWVAIYNSSFAWMAAIASLIVMSCIALRWYWPALILTLVKLNAMIFLVPQLPRDLASSFSARYELWLNSLVLWFKAPIFGNGLGSFNHAYSEVAEAHIPVLGYSTFQNVFLYPGQAHNDALTTLVEIGLVGALLCLGFCWSVLRLRTWNMQWARWPLSASVGICMVAFPLFLPSSAFLIAALIGVASRSDAPSRLGCSLLSGSVFEPSGPITSRARQLIRHLCSPSCRTSKPIESCRWKNGIVDNCP